MHNTYTGIYFDREYINTLCDTIPESEYADMYLSGQLIFFKVVVSKSELYY